jgi:tight adherence protein B
MTGLVLAALAATGTFLILTADRGFRPRDSTGAVVLRWRRRARLLLDQAGLDQVGPGQFLGASAVVGLLASVPAVVVFGPGVPALLVTLAATSAPTVGWRRSRVRRRRAARAAWPRLIEELRVLTGSVGRSIPQALIDVGLRGPTELQPAFRAAQREWALTTDLERTVRVLKDRLDDPTADAACETLLVAAEVGGDIDTRLAALAEDRRADLAGRREAEAKQAGARFARAFVILVPAGMALAGLSVGDGRAAYQSPTGQLLVAAGLVAMTACWWWSGRVMRLPEPERVFDR